jgi:hypothetical protein
LQHSHKKDQEKSGEWVPWQTIVITYGEAEARFLLVPLGHGEKDPDSESPKGKAKGKGKGKGKGKAKGKAKPKAKSKGKGEGKGKGKNEKAADGAQPAAGGGRLAPIGRGRGGIGFHGGDGGRLPPSGLVHGGGRGEGRRCSRFLLNLSKIDLDGRKHAMVDGRWSMVEQIWSMVDEREGERDREKGAARQ